jgi:hypothetical protein
MKKELEELCEKFMFELEHSGNVFTIKEPLFTNTIGEKFYNKKDRVYWFVKKSFIKDECVLDYLDTYSLVEESFTSQIYKTSESRDKALEEYKESLKPKYRPFNMDEADEYLGLKLERKDKRVYKILYKISTVDALNEYFRNWRKLDGSPVGKLIDNK